VDDLEPGTMQGIVQNGKAALDSATSEAAAARIAVNARLSGDATRAYADTVITDSESALAPIEGSFGGVDPPSKQEDDLRNQVFAVLGDVDDALSSARIAVRRDDRAGLAKAATDLATVLASLGKLRESLG